MYSAQASYHIALGSLFVEPDAGVTTTRLAVANEATNVGDLAFGPAAGLLHFSEVRRLENRLRETFEIGPTPIRIRFRRDEARKARRIDRKRPRNARKQRT